MDLKIEFITITPLLQIEDSSVSNGVPTVFQKRKECIENGKIGKFPYYSGNGFRGMLHRSISNYVLTKAIEKGIKVDPTNFHILNAGGGSNFQDQPMDVANRTRDLNPIASVFGISLAIEGKLMVSDFEPLNKRWIDGKIEGTQYSGLVKNTNYIKKDDILDGAQNAIKIFAEEDIVAYQETNLDTQEARGKARDTKSDEKIKKSSIKAYNAREYVLPGTKFIGYIGAKDEFTSIERGMILKALELSYKKQLGSTHNLGFGVVEYSVQREDEDSTLEIANTLKNQNNIFNPIAELKYTKEDKTDIAAFEAWCENITEENILLSKTLLENVQ